MTRTTPELPPTSPNFSTTPEGGYLATTYYLTCNRPHTQRIFSGNGFRTLRPRSQNHTTRSPRSSPTQQSLELVLGLQMKQKFTHI
ncbi:hypothetical protein AVEN_147136-1 [Araneus ventricosus]|uniref:Uncharacterized protein n=1 Tax=Araneus ventricosus TaxID=182803 RepID=A0A4Y2GFA2_ARAVE|nr:hypothetical protein AVEN_147136-1 [Araneus ventricosus]